MPARPAARRRAEGGWPGRGASSLRSSPRAASDPSGTDRHSVQANAALVRDCLNEIRDDADRNLPTPVPWRECLPASIILLRLPDVDDTTTTLLLDAYLADWARADAADEAGVRAALAADLA